MFTSVHHGYILPSDLTAALRRMVFPLATTALGAGHIGHIEQLTNGLWWTLGEVYEHADFHFDKPITTGLIIINDCNVQLCTENTLFDIPVGTVYRIDSTKPHSTRFKPGFEKRNQIFAFLAWDSTELDAKPIAEWAMEACDDLSYFSHRLRPRPPGES
jgi:hypothetical protein